MKKYLCIIILFLTSITAIIGSFYIGKKSVIIPNQIQYIDYEEFKEIESSHEDFILYIGRPSCKICAVVSNSLHKFVDDGLKIYVLDMEPYLGESTYSEIKENLDFYYMPSFKYFENGKAKYHMNNPLDESYYDDSADRMLIKKEMENKIYAFINGIKGAGDIINEKPQTNTVVGKEVELP